MKAIRNQTIPAAIVFGSYYASNCVFFSYINAYLSDMGYSGVETGLIFTIIYLSSSICAPLIGYLTDTYIPYRKFIPLALCVSMPFVAIIPFLGTRTIPMVCCIVITAIAQTQLNGVLDSWVVTIRERFHSVNYPSARLVGSLGFSCSAVLVGYLLPVTGYSIIFILNIVFCIIHLVGSLYLTHIPCVNAKTTENKTATQTNSLSFTAAMVILMKNGRFLVFFITQFLFYAGLRMTLTFHPQLLSAIGGDSVDLGYSIFMSAIMEVPVMLVLARWRPNRNLQWFLALSLFIGAVKGVILVLTRSTTIFILAQSFQGLGLGIMLVVALDYIRKIVPENIYSTACTLYYAATAGIASIAASFFGGLLLDFSRNIFLLCAMGLMMVSPVIMGGFAALTRRRYENSAT